MDVVLENPRLQVIHRYSSGSADCSTPVGLTPVDLDTAAALTTERCRRVSRETWPRRYRSKVGGWSQNSGSALIRSLLT